MKRVSSFPRIFCVLCLLSVMLALSPVQSVRAASIVVNSLEDTDAVDGKCTLREAIENATNDNAGNGDCAAGSGADTITFSVSGTITLGSTLSINQGYTAVLTIDGTGQTVTISGNDAVQVVYVRYGSLTLNNLTIANGTGQGGGISNSGTLLTITNCTFSGNHANGEGGAIFNHHNNTAGHRVIITNSTFSGNTAEKGGAIYNAYGYSYDYDTQVTITNSTFSGNSTPGGLGGGIYNGGSYSTLTITSSTFSGNGASWGSGGGIYNDDGSLTIRTSTFSGNSAGTGGGIYNYGGYQLTIGNSTFSGNSASNSGSNGGGIYNSGAYASIIITNSTFSGNSVPGSGGGIGNAGGTVTLRNTIVANNMSGNCSGAIANGANNLDSGTTCGWGSTQGSMSNVNPLLGALTGSPAYFPLNTGSPAIDKGEDTICAVWPVNNQSQNGVARPQGAHCDIGSYEFADVVALTVLYLPLILR